MEKEKKKSLSYTDIITGNMSYSLEQIIEPLKEEHLKTVWLMRNDEEVRKYAESDKEISWQEFEATFKYTDYPKFVFKNKSTGEIMGYFDFRNDMVNDDSNVKEWSFFLGPDHRGKGWSEIMLDLAIDWAKDEGYNIIRATVKEGNIVSHYVHDKLGFQVIKKDRHETIYTLNISN